jgi:hypothetical protein
MTLDEHDERADQVGKLISFRAPTALAKQIEEAAGAELLSTSAYCRRAALRSVMGRAAQ